MFTAGSRRRVLQLWPALALVIGFFALEGAAARADEPLDVVATTGMIADVVRNVAGEHAAVTQLMGQGVDPHLYKATRSDVTAMLRADLVFYNGLLLEGKLTDALVASIESATTKAELEDLYLPYKPKRRTKGQIACERGLEPLAACLLADRDRDPEAEAAAYLGNEVPDVKAALEGARDILIEQLAEQADLLGRLRRHLLARAQVQTS